MNTSSTWPSRNASIGSLRAVTLAMALPALLISLAVPVRASAATAIPNATLPVSVSGIPSVEVEEVLSGVPLKDLSAEQLSKELSQLPALSALPSGPLQEALTTTIEGLIAKGGTLGQLTGSGELVSNLDTQLTKLLSPPQLLALLEGKSLSSVLNEALGTLSARQLLGGLLSSSGEPEQLIAQVLATANPEKLRALLNTTLTGEPFTKSTVAQLASNIGMTSEGLATALNTTTSQLPAGAMALTAPLTNGKTLGVLGAAEGVTLGLMGSAKEKTPGASPGGSGGGAGGSGGSGGGSSGTPPGTTLIVNNPLAHSNTTLSANANKLAKIKILSCKIRGHVVTLVIRVSAAGKLTLSGKGVRTVSKQTDQAERVTLRTILTKAAAASLHKHHHMKLKLKASFTEVSGPSSSTATTVRVG
jgi:hypothetical protein